MLVLNRRHVRGMVAILLAIVVVGSWNERRLLAWQQDSPPAVGEQAIGFKLATLSGETVELTELTKRGPVVLVVLRGFPGYQCPVCEAQVGQFLAGAKKLADAKANVVFVYPGPAAGLQKHATDFVRGKTIPENVYLTLDPDFELVNKYHLRWNAKNETAYPATFVIDSTGKVQFAKVSKTHGGRASLEEVLKTLGS
jgi:thioredoxin-dependent peroxiredoxin